MYGRYYIQSLNDHFHPYYDEVLHFLLSKINKLVLTDLISYLPREKPRDVAFIPAVLKGAKMASIVN